MSMPARLDMVLDEIGAGAILEHLETGRRALVIDIDSRGMPILVRICEEWVEREDGKSASKPGHYEIFKLGEDRKGRKKSERGFITEDMKLWLVLNAGHDRLLDHEEDP